MSATDEIPAPVGETCESDAHPARPPFQAPAAGVMEIAAAMMRAAGDPARLGLLLRLADGERCVSELAEAEGDKVATVSARLQLLHGARLVTRRRQAKHVYYALADDHVVCFLKDLLDHAAEEQPHPA
ncbi:MAG: helix-turn-helix domain-containing protein [Pseudomonadota bacterium]